jgi:flagellar hook-basal body complex protein FliE
MPAIEPSSLAGAFPTGTLPTELGAGAGAIDDPAALDAELGALEGTSDAGGSSFDSVLGRQITALADVQAEGAAASQALATGTATDVESVVMAVERARLSMQLASQLRTKGVEAINEIFRTQV